MNISKNSVAKKLMMMALTVAGATSLAFATNNTHIHAHAAARPQVSIQYNNKQANNRNNNVQVNNNRARVNVNRKQVNNNQAQNTQRPQQSRQFNRIYKIAKSKLGDRYVWGGNGPHHFDCSGFTRYVYQKGLHKTLPRLAGDQYYGYKHISKAHRRPGDLVFFGSSRRNITHVGMYVGNGKMIDAQLRGVIIEKIAVPWWHAVGYSRPFNLR